MFSVSRQFHLPLISIATHAKEKIQPNVDSHKSCNYKEKCNFDLGNYLGFLFVPTQIRIEFLLHSLLQKHRYLESLRYSGIGEPYSIHDTLRYLGNNESCK